MVSVFGSSKNLRILWDLDPQHFQLLVLQLNPQVYGVWFLVSAACHYTSCWIRRHTASEFTPAFESAGLRRLNSRVCRPPSLLEYRDHSPSSGFLLVQIFNNFCALHTDQINLSPPAYSLYRSFFLSPFFVAFWIFEIFLFSGIVICIFFTFNLYFYIVFFYMLNNFRWCFHVL
jgi:hypothetical protein